MTEKPVKVVQIHPNRLFVYLYSFPYSSPDVWGNISQFL